MRVACLQVPLFPLAARLRSEPDLAREAVAILEGNGAGARVAAASRTARKAGVQLGLTLTQARALCPRLAVRPRDRQGEHTAQQALIEAAEGVSPRVEDGGPGRIYADLEGLERHFPSEDDLAQALVRAAERQGLPVWVGIASSKLAARVAAGLPGSPTLVPPGEEASFLAPLPLRRLSSTAQVAETLAAWGIHRAGELARLPSAEVASRLGTAGEKLHALARGFDARPLMPRQLPAVFEEGMTLEWPLVSLEPFLFIARAALERLCKRLEERGLACLRLDLSLHLEPEGYAESAHTLPAPTRDPKTLLTLVRLDLEAKPPGAPVQAFTFTAHPDRPREAQLSLFGPAALPPDRLATTLARLFALLGPDGVGSPRPVDGHRPEAFQLVSFEPPPPPREPPEPRRGRGLFAVRVLRPPVEVEVITADGPGTESTPGGSPPLEIQALVREETEKRPRIQGRVLVASGPWVVEEEWWAEHPTQRGYWDVELADGGLYRLFRDASSGRWFADGIYD